MLRLILILVLMVYVLHRFGFFQALGKALGGDPGKTGDGDVKIDSSPKEKKEKKAFKGGDYVDYEDVN